MTGITECLKLSSVVHTTLFDAKCVCIWILAKAVHLIAFSFSFLPPVYILGTTSGAIVTSTYVLKEIKMDFSFKAPVITGKKLRYKPFQSICSDGGQQP